jgi:cyclophilin family peptidyl-prolyl cis-trans isomerase
LPKNYVIFGKVVEGLETVDAIATAKVKADARGEMSVPITPVQIKSVEVIEI